MTHDEKCRRCHEPLVEDPLLVEVSTTGALPEMPIEIGDRTTFAFTRAFYLIRQASGYTHRDLARLTGKPRTYFWKLERRTIPSVENAQAVCSAMKIPFGTWLDLAELIMRIPKETEAAHAV
jgi:hypothetical protein